MNANDTNKLTSNIQSFADRLKNDARSSTMFEADWDTLMDAKTMLRQQQVRIDQLLKTHGYLYKKHDEQQAEIAELKRMNKSLQIFEGMALAEIEALKEKSHCCPDCGCHFTGSYPFNYEDM